MRRIVARRGMVWVYLLWLALLGACSQKTSEAPSEIKWVVSANAVTLTWQDNSKAETGFAVDRKMLGETTFTELVALEPNKTTYTDSSIVPGQQYVYRVRALGLAGEVSSPETAPVTPAPGATATLEIVFASNSTGSGTVSSTPAGLNCNLKQDGVCQAVFPIGSTITLTASPAALSSFAAWEGCEGNALTCQLTLTEDKTVQVRFVPVRNTLTVQKAGDGKGRVTSGTPPDIDCGKACVASYEGEVTFRLRAEAEVGSSFVAWSNNCTLVSSLCEVKIGGGKGATVTATFRKIPPPVINTFSAAKTAVVVGGSVTFSWNVTGEQISSLVLRDDKPATADISVTGRTSYTLTNVRETATYTLVATNAFKNSTTSRPVTVRVGTAPALSELAATPRSDGTFTLTWKITGSTPIAYTLTDVATGQTLTPTGSPFVFKPTTLPATYRLEANNDFGVAAPLTVTLTPPVAASIVKFEALPDNFLLLPGSKKLSWEVIGNAPVTLSLKRDDTGEIIPLTKLSGELEVSVRKDTTFTLKADNDFGTDEASLTIAVGVDD